MEFFAKKKAIFYFSEKLHIKAFLFSCDDMFAKVLYASGR